MSATPVDPSPRAWLRRYRKRSAARVRLVCLPPGGAGASFYRPIAARLPPSIDLVAVQYPGRQDRIDETCIDDMAEMVGYLGRVLHSIADRPLALFGHSLGGAVAFEVAHRLEQEFGLVMRCTIVSGRPAPSRPRPGTRHLDDDLLWQDLRRLGGAADEVLNSPALRRRTIAALRADYRLIETYRPGPPAPLTGALEAWLGSVDPEVSAAEAAIWRRFTRADFRVRVFAGAHFYLWHRPDEVVAALVDRLSTELGDQPREEGVVGWGNRC
ncbi:thioesterase II family protein [Nocardia sp. NPDC051321]|uniref:thioesterase II family protein n=1 Tax=Nocardia sp. NPDC051321 TaxID=3364323 RepID=UPI003792302C